MARKCAKNRNVVRRTYELDVKLDRRAGAFARINGLRESQVVTQALNLLLRGFSVSAGVNAPASAEGADEATAA